MVMTIDDNNSQVNEYQTKTLPPQPVKDTPTATGELGDLLALMARLRRDCP